MQLLRFLPWVGYQLGIEAFNSGGGSSQEVLGAQNSEPYYDSQLENYAAWIPSENSQLEVAEAPFPKVGDDELIIKNHVVAVNPVDWKIQSSHIFNLTYPAILGEDVAGEVLQVGLNLKYSFQVGDRVIAHTLGLGRGPAYGGFQLYPVVGGATTSLVPEHVSFTEAAVLPLSISTAAAGLFMTATLGLDYPKASPIQSGAYAITNDTPILLLWGGSSSVGSSVIQLASAAGYAVITTASPAHFNYCKELGAAYVLDYHKPDVLSKLIHLLRGKNLVGAYDAIGSETTVRQCASILHAVGGGKIASVGFAPGDLPAGVTIARISAGSIVTQEPEVAREIWGGYVPFALKSGKLTASPPALIVGEGLGEVQKGLDRQKQGVSARKVVVVLG
jgi:NADPH:quinone reductase-like Zn-dependent oxidoreductase